MELEKEKTWFVYHGDHHEGPFALPEIESRMAQGVFSTLNFVWKEGMGDWKPMTEVADFATLIKNNAPPVEIETQPTPVATHEPTVAMELPKKSASTPKRRIRYGALLAVALFGGVSILLIQGYLNPFFEIPVVKSSSRAALDLARPTLLRVSDQVPGLGVWISPIPALDDVSPEDFEELKAKARTTGLGIAVSRMNLAEPTFYLSSNQPDGTSYELTIQGIPDTLLNSSSFTAQGRGTLTKRLGKATLTLPPGTALPRGEFIVQIRDGDSKTLATKTFFLGGEKDTIYTSRLKEYHDRLREKAAQELSEIKQYAATLDTQLRATQIKFTELKLKKISPQVRKAWGSFDLQWSQLDSKLGESFQKWTPLSFKSEFFYGALYEMTQATGGAIARLHRIHDTYFKTSVDKLTFDIQLGEATSSAQGALSALKLKIEKIEKLGTSPNGLPRKEGS